MNNQQKFTIEAVDCTELREVIGTPIEDSIIIDISEVKLKLKKTFNPNDAIEITLGVVNISNTIKLEIGDPAYQTDDSYIQRLLSYCVDFDFTDLSEVYANNKEVETSVIDSLFMFLMDYKLKVIILGDPEEPRVSGIKFAFIYSPVIPTPTAIN